MATIDRQSGIATQVGCPATADRPLPAMRTFAPSRVRTFFVTALATAALAGCASLDTAPDMERATDFVAERSGESPRWDLPWDEPHAIWDGVSPLTSDDAVRIALVNNRSIRASLEQIAIARADLVQSGLLPNPVLNVVLGFPFDGSGGATSVSVGLTQQLVTIWMRSDRMSAAAFDLDRAVLSVSDDALELVTRVRQQHAAIAFAERERDLLASQVELLGQLVSLMQRRRDAGEATRLDVNRLALQRHSLQGALIEQEQELTQHKLALLALMGWTESPLDWQIAEPDRIATPPLNRSQLLPRNEHTGMSDLVAAHEARLPDERELIALIDTQRLDVLAARANAQARAGAMRIEDRRRLFRSIDAGAEFERDEDRRKEIGPSVSLEIPVLDTNDAAVARALAEYRQAAIEADRVRQAAVAELRIVRSELARLMDSVQLQVSEILPAAEENLRLVRQSIEAGVVDATVLIEAQRDRIDAQLRLNDLRRRLTNRWHELDRVVGGGLLLRPPTAPHAEDTADVTDGAEQ